MKNFINSFCIALLLIFVCCKDEQNLKAISKTETKQVKEAIVKDINYSNFSYIDPELDSTIYKLDICSTDEYFNNELYRETLVLTRQVFIGDSCFGGYANISKALTYSKKIKKQAEGYTKISICIKNKDGKFGEVWFWKQEMYNGELAGKVVLDEGYFNYRNQNEKRIKISYNYEFPDYFKLNTLNFIKEKINEK